MVVDDQKICGIRNMVRCILKAAQNSQVRLCLVQVGLAKTFERANHQLELTLFGHANVGRIITAKCASATATTLPD